MKLKTYMQLVRKQIIANSKNPNAGSASYFTCIVSANVFAVLATKTKNDKQQQEYYTLHRKLKLRVADWIGLSGSVLTVYRIKTGTSYADETYTQTAYQARIYMLDELIKQEK